MSERHEDPEGHKVEILVNEMAVFVDGEEQTGFTIKEAAIRQRVPIERDFVLLVEREGHAEFVHDDESIKVHSHARFVAAARDHDIEIFVNEKPVYVKGHRQTGLNVKEAAIKQGVAIKADFILSIELGGGKTKIVGDEEPITVHKHERFLAIENDDNS